MKDKYNNGILAVIDGSKALRRALKDVFGRHVFIQRYCGAALGLCTSLGLIKQIKRSEKFIMLISQYAQYVNIIT